MVKQILTLAVVGHANVGKTSLLRTLARNRYFGKISSKPGTTRHTEGIRLINNDETFIELFDTPGLEDSIALFDYLESLSIKKGQYRLDNYSKIEQFLVGPEATHRFEQEAKVLRQLIKSDAGLYVIDVREPVLPKYKDELEILSYCAKPLLPVFNFTVSERANKASWHQALSRLGLHVFVEFDTVFPPLEGEKQLYESLMLLVPSSKPVLQEWLEDLHEKRQMRKNLAAGIIANVLIDVTAAVYWIDNKNEQEAAIKQLQLAVKKRERHAINELLKLYQFDKEMIDASELPLLEGRFSTDLFSNEAIKQMGLRLSKGVLSGAMTGAGIDLAVGGLTLGTAAVVGAVVGGLSQSMRHYGKQLSGLFSGKEKLTVNDEIICLLSLRLLELQQRLDTLGHASHTTVTLTIPNQALWQKGHLLPELRKARVHPEWSSLNKKLSIKNGDRKACQQILAQQLMVKID